MLRPHAFHKQPERVVCDLKGGDDRRRRTVNDRERARRVLALVQSMATAQSAATRRRLCAQARDLTAQLDFEMEDDGISDLAEAAELASELTAQLGAAPMSKPH